MSAETWMALVAVALVLGAVFYGPPAHLRPRLAQYEAIHTVDPVHPTVQCILVRDTHIADVDSLCLEHSQLIQHSGHHDPLMKASRRVLHRPQEYNHPWTS